MYAFDYRRPDSLAAAVEAIEGTADGKFIAGGQSLLPVLKQRLASPSDLVDLARIEGLRGISAEGDSVVIGAMTRHADVAASADVAIRIPALATLAGDIGDRQVRNRGTLGGSIANNDPAADYPAACLGLGAVISTTERTVAAEEFFCGLFETALGDSEIVTAVRFPVPEQAGYAKFPHPASRYAIAGVFVARTSGGVRVAVTGAGADGVFRAEAMEHALERDFSPAALDAITIPPAELNSDMHASAEYRAHLIGVMARRAVAACR